MKNQRNMKGPFEVLSTKEVYKNEWITVREDAVVRPGGKEGIFGIIDNGMGVSVLPIDENGWVYLGKEYKYGIEDYSIEVFSGAGEKGEEPLTTAKRELEEELGKRAENWERIMTISPMTTIVDAKNHLHIARGLVESKRNLDEGEEIELMHMPLEEAYAMIGEGKIVHAGSVILIMHAYHARETSSQD